MAQSASPTPTLAGLLNTAWGVIARGVTDRASAARHPALATAGLRGGASARVVVLRAADRAEATLTVHTDSASSKVAELSNDPAATLLIWDADAHLQLRAKCLVDLRPGSQAEWERVPDTARLAYGGSPYPGQAIATPGSYRPGAARERFLVLIARIDEIEVLDLAQTPHLRARFRRSSDWQGEWLVP